MSQCTARSKRTGKQCGAQAMAGSTKCYHHGGATPKGIASSSFKTGRYSKYLPTNLQGKYQEALADPELLSMRQDIALVDARLAEQLARLEAIASQHLSLPDAADPESIDAYASGVNSKQSTANKINYNISEAEIWTETISLLEQRRKLVESEQKRLVAMEQVITSEQAMTFVTSLLQAVKAHVTDRQQLQAIQNEFIRLTTRTADRRVSAGRDSDADS